MNRLLLGLLAATSIASAAAAADLPSRKYAPAPVAFVPAFSWTGFYAGVQAGYGWGKAPAPWGAPATTAIFPNFQSDFNQKGGFAGGHIGYNYQINQFVIGLEGDVNASWLNGNDGGSGGHINGLKHKWNASIRARAGYAFDRALLYVTGGWAYLDATATRLTPPNEYVSTTFSGWTVGAGLEYAITNNWTVRGEYRYTDYGKSVARFTASGYAERINPRVHTVQLGVSYKF